MFLPLSRVLVADCDIVTWWRPKVAELFAMEPAPDAALQCAGLAAAGAGS